MAETTAPAETVEGNQVQEKAPEVKALEEALAKAKEHSVSLERAITRQSRDLSEQRKLIDKIYAQQLAPKEEKVDFFANPEQALDQRIGTHPTIQGLAVAAQTLKQQQMAAALTVKHPDYREVATNEDFLKWIGTSAKRAEMYLKADQEYDFSSADYLLSEWKEKKQVNATAKAEAEAKAKNESDLRAAKVTTGGSVSSSKKIWTSEELQRLRITDRDKYEALNPAQLYADGRVKKAKEIS